MGFDYFTFFSTKKKSTVFKEKKKKWRATEACAIQNLKKKEENIRRTKNRMKIKM